MKSITKQRLLASTLFMGAMAVGSPAFAQDQQTNTQEETADVGDPAARFCADNPTSPQCEDAGTEIIVTGSRIARPELVSPSPLQIIDAQDIDNSGAVNIQQVLLENPVVTPAITRTNSNFQTSSVGVATVDLRDLGSDRTLVLVNGRRFVAGIPSSATVDLNTIPTQFIERVDILTGGSSAIYGSDAVAGVVNIVYKTDFEGLEVDAQYGRSDRGDDKRKQANLLLGTNFADDRGNIIVHLGYSDEGAVFSRDRPNLGAELDQLSCTYFSGAAEDLFTACRPFLSSFAPGGTFLIAPGVTRTFSPEGNLIPVNTNCVVPGSVPFESIEGCTPTGFNRSNFRTIAVPTERYLIALNGNYEIADNVAAFVEGTFAQSRTTSEIEPFPLSGADVFEATGGRFNIETRLPDGTVVQNPLVPDFFFDNAVDTAADNDDLRDVGLASRRLSDFGNRGNTANRTTYRVLTGLKGDIFGGFNWDAFYSYGETSEDQRGTGQINVINFANAVNAIPGPGGTVICADPTARAQGCVPLDIFGPNAASPEAVNYVEAPSSRTTRTTQQLAGANLSGELFQLWDGAAGIAVGAEYRKEFSEELNDPLTEQGLNAGNALPSSEGEFDVQEAYAELVLPILRNRPFFHDLTVNGAVRVSDYSTIGSTLSYNAGVEFSPIRDVRLRSVYARATRAPNIGELFSPQSQTFPTGLVDPCLGVGTSGGGVLGDQCRADPGVLANIQQNGVFTLNQSDIQGVSGFGGGNPDLQEEKAKTFTAGVIINPRSISWLRNFAFTADYFNIRIKDAIVDTPRQFILDQCFREGNDEFCGFVLRRPTAEGLNSPGSLEFINTGPTNSGGIETEGLDFTLSYRSTAEALGLNFLGGGSINARIAYTRMLEGFVIPLPGSDKDPYVGEVGTPKDKAFFSLSYDAPVFGVTFTGSYIGPVFLDDDFLESFGFEARDENARIGDEFYGNVQFRVTPFNKFEIYAGVNNLFDNDAPPIISGLPGNSTGTETAAGSYDPIGRRFYAGVRARFGPDRRRAAAPAALNLPPPPPPPPPVMQQAPVMQQEAPMLPPPPPPPPPMPERG
ncbi:MAG: TonB-dependent receptor [Pseudomonadota bacterium]|nr:TonB-dependent receptor [Pseudomonadota bacterium]